MGGCFDYCDPNRYRKGYSCEPCSLHCLKCTNADKCDICIDNYSLVVITDSVNSLS